MRSIFKTGILLILTTLALSGKAQVAQNLQTGFEQYNNRVLKEKLYVHTDKNFYLTGEIIWFKIYNVDAKTNKPLNLSRVAYIEVLDAANNPVLQGKIAIDYGTGDGSFYIPVTLINGNYKLRAYTSWMKNFGPDVFFEKAITIVNPLTEPLAASTPTTRPVSVQFFAEGGHLLTGAENTVSFKATGTDGKSIDISGVVINQRNDTVARFKTLKFGIGSFNLTPEANGSYKAVMRLGSNNSLITNLPEIQPKGYAIHLTTNGGQPIVKVSQQGSSNPMYMFVHCGQQVVLAQSIAPDANGNASVTIDKARLGKGINHITLFNADRQPVCERLFFNRPAVIDLQAQVQAEFKTRSAVNIPLSTKSQAGAPLMANLSVTVFQSDSLTQTDAANIESYLWLTADLKGNIESPNYYFNKPNAETDAALDNLLLVQGWSKFKWDEVLNNNKKFIYLPELEGHIITGKINNPAGQPAANIPAYLSIPGKRTQLYTNTADSTGRLLFITKQLFGPGEIVLQTNTEKDNTTYAINIDNPFSDQHTTTTLSPFKLDNYWQRALVNSSINMQVQNIYVAGKLKQYNNPMIDSSAFYGSFHKAYLLDDYTRFKTMEEVLREYVAEMTVTRRQKRIHFNVLSPGGIFLDGDPLVMLDGVPIFNLDKVFLIDPLKIKRLDMVNQQFYWGPATFTGVVNMTSYKGDMAGFEIDPKAVVLDYEGMQLQREFFSPVYETDQQKNSRMPDFRNVLYWAPNINTNAQGNADVKFYTSDKIGNYTAIFQGLTADGQAGSCVIKFEVSN